MNDTDVVSNPFAPKEIAKYLRKKAAQIKIVYSFQDWDVFEKELYERAADIIESTLGKTCYVRLNQFTTQSEMEKIRQELQKHSTDLICILPAYAELLNPEQTETVDVKNAVSDSIPVSFILEYGSALLKRADGLDYEQSIIFKGSSQAIMTMIDVYRKMEKSGEESKDDGENDADH